MIAKGFIIGKDFYTYSIKILRQEEILRDHRHGRWPTPVSLDARTRRAPQAPRGNESAWRFMAVRQP
jgi:hypothetical protein